MLTVIAIDESLMHEIGEFEPLLTSVSRKGDYKICGWKRNEVTLQNAIPALFDREFISEGELLEWNILIVSDNRGCYAHNPFEGNYAQGTAEENIQDKQLNELAKMLGVVPVESNFTNKRIDQNSGKITWDIEVDKSTRDEKLSKYTIKDFTRPKRIYLLAVQKEFDVEVEQFKNEQRLKVCEFAHFSADGLYPPNCRFFKFNLSSFSNKTTTYDYFRLWMSILAFAYNDDADDFYFATDTLYSIDAEVDEFSVKARINEIYSRVHGIKKTIETRIDYIHRMREFNQTKKYSLPQFTANVEVEYQTDETGLYLNEKEFGLAKNCPVDNDERAYDKQREKIEKRIKDYLKAPQRALRRAVYETKIQGVYHHKSEEFLYLNREQREDMEECINETEIELLNTADVNINYPKENEMLRKQADKRTHSVMKRRSNKKAIILGSVFAFLAMLLTFLPYIFGKTVGQRVTQSYLYALLVTIACIILLAIAGFITLLVLKKPLRSALFHFKCIINALVAFVKEQASVYTKYLSKLSRFMQMNSFMRYVDSNVNDYKRADENKLIVNRNYCEVVEQMCKQWADNLNFSLIYDDKMDTVIFDLDNKPEQNSVFSFVVSNGDQRILYNNKESKLYSPYPFITSLNITSEEVYE